ncbi:M28 family metallopeptidase [Terrabacter sp. MAHUQ-38]|uniref:M28 family metallopeptidase n=1 Tax=unclassified Terrabacter TaxID=2630222 RepID=UPI00165E5E7F|nr:M28 family metallopeptidase [Terrabacter sp. MAHUQ-38]MBC9820529.1 M28 family peptidase [Terrabacter sp. MAHUQ-38]
MRLRNTRFAAAFASAALVIAAAGSSATNATAAPATCAARVNSTIASLLECVELAGVREHQAALQAIADANGGTRFSGSPGFDASAAYVADKLRAAGWTVTTQPFDFVTFEELSPSVLEEVAPVARSLPHNIMSYSGSGDVTAAVSTPSGDQRGCVASDWAGFPAGNIALVSRGTPTGFPVACTFALKASNAIAAGATGVIVYNNIAGPLNGTLGAGFTGNVPVVGIEQALGLELAATPGLIVHLKTDTLRETVTTSNVLAELRGKNSSNVVMAGAHLDSVNAGPGINDNGSGSAALVEIAENLAKVKPQNTLRFAWWGAEEANLIGSTFYVNTLPMAELQKIALYLNFDMIGSPNYVFFIYDGDDSDRTGAGPGPAGSAQIEKTFEAYFTSRGLPFKGTDFSGRSDYGPFIASGVPSGGLFTGAEGIKTAQEAAIWGGTAGQAYDPCYHQACDTYANNNNTALAENSDAVAYAVLSYAMSTNLINGTKSKGNFRPPPPPGEVVLATS